MIAEKDAALDVLPDAWDSKGHPAVRATSGGWLSAAMILGHNISILSTQFTVVKT